MWQFNTIYSFKGGTDGAGPYGELIAGGGGKLYGTTLAGGGSGNCTDSYNYSNGQGCGTVFVLAPPSHGGSAWSERVLHAFVSGNDGRNPAGRLYSSPAGDLFGTTLYGGGGAQGCIGSYGPGCGVAFELTKAATGTALWNETVLHTFTANIDGAFPEAGLIALTKGGNLYGTTAQQGGGYGTTYEITLSGTVTVLHALSGGPEGEYSFGGVVKGKDAALYGTAAFGGSGGFGTVYQVVP